MKRDLRDMVVVITGASSGIGQALAEELSRRGARLVLAARRAERLEEINRSLGGGHLVVRADVSVQDECKHLIDAAADRFGRIDTLVCNAGYGVLRSVVESSLEESLQMMRTNFFGTTECIRFAVPLMLKQDARDGLRGQVVIVSSAVARRALPFLGIYSATKAAQLSIAESLRVELRDRAIAVTSIHPIGTHTEFHAAAERRGSAKLPPRSAAEPVMSPQTVAMAMIRGIESPKPEIWPHKLSRLALSLSTAFPAMTDRLLSKRAAVTPHPAHPPGSTPHPDRP